MIYKDMPMFYITELHTYPKSCIYVKDDTLDNIKKEIDALLGEDCFLNHMTTDEKPYQNTENFIVRRLNRKINTLKSRNHSHRKYIRLLHKIINLRDREIRELKRNQICSGSKNT